MHKCKGCKTLIEDSVEWCSMVCKKRVESKHSPRNYGKSEYYGEIVLPVSVVAGSIADARRLLGKLSKSIKSKRLTAQDYDSNATVVNRNVKVTEARAIRRILTDELARIERNESESKPES